MNFWLCNSRVLDASNRNIQTSRNHIISFRSSTFVYRINSLRDCPSCLSPEDSFHRFHRISICPIDSLNALTLFRASSAFIHITGSKPDVFTLLINLCNVASSQATLVSRDSTLDRLKRMSRPRIWWSGCHTRKSECVTTFEWGSERHSTE